MPTEKYLDAHMGDIPLERKLADTRQALEDFAYTVAHDLNAALRIMVSFSQLLHDRCRNGQCDDKALHYVDVISTNGAKAQAQLAGLLQYSRLDTIPLKTELVECNDIVGQCLKQLKQDIDASGAWVIVGLLPEVTADSIQLALLFRCLLSNALKFSTRHPEIEITALRGHEAWVFSVSDRGIGIAFKDHKTIFNVFRRLHRDEEYSGTGMGLALARRIVELHGGVLWVESRPHSGTAFYFSLPDVLPFARSL